MIPLYGFHSKCETSADSVLLIKYRFLQVIHQEFPTKAIELLALPRI